MSEFDLKKLSKKFNEEDIEWRVQQSGAGKKGAWALIIPYITNRAIMKRLDDSVGMGNWTNEFKASPCGTGYLCGISIKIDNEWVTRWDGAEKSDSTTIDNVKSTISSSMKRTGVQWGIGRYLYQFEASFAITQPCDFRSNVLPGYTFAEDKKKNLKYQWKPKPLEAWALPVTNKDIKARVDAILAAKTEEDMKLIYKNSYKFAVSEDDDEMLARFVKAKDDARVNFSSSKDEEIAADTVKLQEFIKECANVINETINTSALDGQLKFAIQKLKLLSSGSELSGATNRINSIAAEHKLKLTGVK